MGLTFSFKIKFAVFLIFLIFVFVSLEIYFYNLSIYLIILPIMFSLAWIITLFFLREYPSNFILSFLFALIIAYLVLLAMFAIGINFSGLNNLSGHPGAHF